MKVNSWLSIFIDTLESEFSIENVRNRIKKPVPVSYLLNIHVEKSILNIRYLSIIREVFFIIKN